MLIIPPRKYRRRRGRAKAAAAAPAPAALAVVSVQLIDAATLLWTFSRTVVDSGDTDGYRAGGMSPVDQGGFGGDTITLLYPDVVNVGDEWDVDPASVSTVFDPPGTLAPQDGSVGA